MAPKPRQVPHSSSCSTTRVAIVTGSNTGVGFETAKQLVRHHGFHVIVACRSEGKGRQACKEINKVLHSSSSSSGVQNEAVFLHELDLANFSSVRTFGQKIRETYGNQAIDVLINNGGRNTGDGESSVDGLDLLFQTNFLGHFLLTRLLQDISKRVVHLSSVMHHFPYLEMSKDDRLLDLVDTEDFWRECATYNDRLTKTYSPSKLAALLFSMELSRQGIQSVAVNPGSVNSDIWRSYSSSKRALFQRIYLTPEQGCTTTVAAAILDWENLYNNNTNDQTSMLPLYLQPYWLPSSSSKTPFPPFEMLGPYIGYQVTQPRLPKDGGLQASSSLVKVCEELTK